MNATYNNGQIRITIDPVEAVITRSGMLPSSRSADLEPPSSAAESTYWVSGRHTRGCCRPRSIVRWG